MMILKKNKAFTIIELLVVIAILGIIVLLAVPRLLGHTENARLTQIKSNVRVNEDMLTIRLIEEPDLIESSGWEPIEQDELQKHADLGQLYDREGEVKEVVGGQYYEVPEEEITTNLDGELAVSIGGKLYYYGENLRGEQENIQYTITFLDSDGNVIEEVVIEKGESIEAPEVPNQLNGLYFRGWDKELDEINSDMTVSAIYSGPSDVELGMENDFEWVNSTDFGTYYNNHGQQGYFKYVGTGQDVIEVPHVIQGIEMTSYYRMFDETGEDVKKVISTNENVTNMSRMFWGSQATSLDLSSFDTSSVTYMDSMFQNSQATSLDLSSFDTSSVITMSYMLYNSQATSLDLSSFDTSNVTNMNYIFNRSKAASLDLSSFDTSNVTHMNYMFKNSQATTGYAKTQEDANRLNASSDKPDDLTFQVKSN